MPERVTRGVIRRVSQAPVAVGWLAEPGRIEIALSQVSGTSMPWLEVALALFVLLALSSPGGLALALLVPAAALALGVAAFGWLFESRRAKKAPVLYRLEWEVLQVDVLTADGNTVTRDLIAPGTAYPIRLPLAMRTLFATGWMHPDGTWLVVRHRNRSEATNLLRELAKAGWPTSREAIQLA